MITLLALAATLAASFPQDTIPGKIRGEVRNEVSGAPLPGATVEVRGVGVARTAITDRSGNYLLPNVPSGRWVLRAMQLGHEPLEVEVLVPAGKEVVLDLALRLRPVPITGVVARGRGEGAKSDTLAVPAPALNIAGMRALENAPGVAELGLGDRPQGSPGQAPIDPADVLYVRGGSADLKLMLLDGAPVYTPFHLSGLLEPFETEVLSSATLYLGGAPARYDGGLSYVLDLSTRTPRNGQLRSSGAVDLASARLATEGTVAGGANYLVAGRAIHGLGIAPFLNESLPYSYAEGLARVDVPVSAESKLGFTVFHNREGIRTDSIGPGDTGAGWGNTAVSLRYQGILAGVHSEVTAAFSEFDARLPLGREQSYPTEGATRRFRLTSDFASDLGALRVRYGGSVDRLALRYHTWAQPNAAESFSWSSGASGDVMGAYTDASWQAMPRLRLRGGLRGDVFFNDPAPRLAPRFSATWMLSDHAALTAAAGRYHQYIRTPSAVRVVGEAERPDTLYLPSGLAVGRADHFALALQQELDEGLRLGLEGFFKTFADVPAAGMDGAYASGVDVWLRRDAGLWRGWLGYSLSWVWSQPRAGSTTDEFAGRQLLNLGVTGPVGRWGDLNVRFAYGAGLPFSVIATEPQSSPVMEASPGQRFVQTSSGAADLAPLSPPAEPYLRLDLGLSRSFTTHWRGVPVEISPYLKVLNSLDRRDALFYRFDRRNEPEPRPLAALPVLPLLGVQWKF